MVAKKEDEDYRRPLNKAYDESARGIGNVVGKTADALLRLPQLTYAGGAVKDIYNKGFMNTLGRVYGDSITGATNMMEGTANVLGGAGSDVSRMSTEAGKRFRSGAGIESVDQPAYGNINEQFTAGEAQLNRLDDAQIAPMTTLARELEGQNLTPGNMTQAEINTLKYGPVQNFQPEPGFKGIEGIGGENIYRNTNVDPKKYGQAIYSDTIQGALPSGFDKDIREQGIGVTDPETGVTNTPFSRTAQQNGIGQQTDPARQAYDKANQLMSQMPYGNPGDRQKRANLVAQARTFVGISGGLQHQTEAGRQYGIDVFNSSNPSSV